MWIIRAALAATLLLSLPAVAKAGLRLCNQSYDVLNVAIGVPQDQQTVTRGWWRVAPNQCANLVRDRLQSRLYYVFAADVFGNEVLSGSIPFCVVPRRFEIDSQQDCLLRGFLDARFIEVDTQEQTNWTIFVTPRPE